MVFAKDIILALISKIGVNGATNMVMEFTGPVIEEMSMEERMTICNMAVEAGATSGICMPDETTLSYLWNSLSDEYASQDEALAAFKALHSDKDAKYAKTVDLDVSKLEPMVSYGYSPENVKTASEMRGTKVDQVYIGSCTNGRIEDLRVAASILKGKTVHPSLRGIVSPATPDIYIQALEEGIIKVFMDAGFCVSNPTCGACLGMSNGVLASGEVCASTTNRNFHGRMGRGGMVHLMSPASAAATALTGRISHA
jgi:3-isopropylmalate/(R)-2-methylmalate dehydratase large subunit